MGKYTLCRRVRASFSPEILQAVAVKGLKSKRKKEEKKKHNALLTLRKLTEVSDLCIIDERSSLLVNYTGVVRKTI